MTTTIGRASFSYGPSSVSWSGDTVSLDIPIRPPTTIEQAKVIRQQLLGMMNNPDESAFPVTSTEDSDLDGFYTVRGVNVEPVDSFLRNGVMFCSVGLVRVANGYQNPTIETTVVSQLATNSHSVASTTDWALALVWRDDEEGKVDAGSIFGSTSAGYTHTSIDTTDVWLYGWDAANKSGYWSRLANPATHYSPPRCKIEYKVGSTWYDAVGRQIPEGVPWRISNGFIRIGHDSAFPTSSVFVEMADTGAWVGRYLTVFLMTELAGPFVIRNSPESVTVRVQGVSNLAATYADFTVWQGGVIAQLAMSNSSAATIAWSVALTSTEAGTNVTGGIRTTSNDANGNRITLLCRQAVTTNTGVTSITVSPSIASAVFGIGFSAGAGSGWYAAASMLEALCAPPQWRQRIAAR